MSDFKEGGNMTRQVKRFEILVHGVKHEQSFQGCGLSFTDFADVATGIGSNALEAYEDALDSLAQNGWDCDLDTGPLPLCPDEIIQLPDDAHEEMHVYVSVRVA